MNFRLTMVLTIVLVVAAAVLMMLRPWEAKELPAADAKKNALFVPSMDDVKGVTYEQQGEKQVAFVKEGEGAGATWQMTFPVQAKAETYAVEDLARTLKGLTYREKFEPEGSGYKSASATGTDKPRHTIVMTDGKGTTHTLKLGKSTVDAIYATVDEGKTVYLLESNPLTQLDKDAQEFREKAVQSVNVDNVQQVTLKKPDQAISLAKKEGKWLVEAPIGARANATTVQEVLNELRGIRATGFTDAVAKESPATGLNPPVLTVTALVQEAPATPPTTGPASAPASQPAAKPVTLELGYYVEPVAKKNVYASIAGTKNVFLFDAKSFDKLNKELKDLRDPAVTPAAVGQATEVKLKQAGSPALTMTKKEGAWTVGSQLPGDAAAIQGLLDAVRDLRAIRFVDSAGNLGVLGLDPPQQRIELTVPGQSQHEVILIGKPETADKVTPVMRQGEPTVYLVQTADVEKLKAATLLSLRDKAVERLVADRIKSIVIERSLAEGKITLAREGTNWTVEGKGKAEESKISALLADFTPVTAVKWVAEGQTSQGATVSVKVTSTEGTATTMPNTAPAAGPALEKTVERTLRLYRNEKEGKTEWTAVWEVVEGVPAWTFEPTASLIDHVTKEGYAVPATQAATAPSTAPGTAK